MLHIKGTKKVKFDINSKCAVALGKFDGIHGGHMLLLNQLNELSEQGFTSVVFTFDYKKNHVFDVENMKNIYTSEEKAKVIEETGIDILLEYPFDDEFACRKPEHFVNDILVNMLHAAYIVVGEDFHFGKNRSGDVELLKQLAGKYGYRVIAIPKKISENNVIVSSTLIREQIAAGAMESVIELMGRPYSITGQVVMGKQLGRTIGIPTANILPVKGKIYPPAGVYASRIRIMDDISNVFCDSFRLYSGITNIGDNPTVNEDGNITIETNIFDFDDDIYGKKIKVELISYIRPEIKFDGINQLKEQMNKDMNAARKILK
ncbi:MAG: bifunctional riboflavin kinase/FAD synthetase [Coprococcus sp.]